MVVQTQSERVRRARRTILEMLAATVDLSEAPDILEMLRAYAADPERFPYAERRAPPSSTTTRCISATMPSASCAGAACRCAPPTPSSPTPSTLRARLRNPDRHVLRPPLPETTCVFCGSAWACAHGALKSRREWLIEQGQSPDPAPLPRGARGRPRPVANFRHALPGGVMLTPDKVVTTTCPYCGVGCKLELHLKQSGGEDVIYKVTSPLRLWSTTATCA